MKRILVEGDKWEDFSCSIPEAFTVAPTPDVPNKSTDEIDSPENDGNREED